MRVRRRDQATPSTSSTAAASSAAALLADSGAATPRRLPWPSVGSPGHVFVSLLLEKAGVAMNHVPFPGAQAVTAVVSGDVPAAITGVVDSAAFVRSGQLRPLAVTGPRRLPLLPQVSTLTESGHPGVEYGVLAGLLAPRGMPTEIVVRLNAALRAAATQPALRGGRDAAGALIEVSSSAEMQHRVRDELPFWRGVVQRAGIKAE